jgi:GNAT superfamily N-acetyltransferase
MRVTIRKVTTRQDEKAFFEFPWKLYADDPNWVPPLLSIRRETLDRDKNPSWAYLDGDYYVAWRGDESVGTIAAFVNHRHNEFHEENIAWFGFFETINDQAVAGALLQTAFEWARSHGYDALRGPQSFTTHEECGLLVEGFERPVMLMPYNPPYYQRLIENAGLTQLMDTYSMRYSWEQIEENNTQQRVQRIVDRLQQRSNITVRNIEKRNRHADFARFKDLYNDAWVKNWGFTPMTNRELDALVEGLGIFFDPHLACFAEVDGDPIGFMLGVPDFNQVLDRARPRPGIPEPLTLLRAAWHWKIRPKIDNFRIPLMGVREAYRKQGVDILMYNYFLNELPKRPTYYRSMDAGWILETNQDMLSVMKNFGLTRYRTYRFYQKPT